MEDPITAFDLGRMMLGDEPPLFLLEIAFRTVVIYLYTFVLIRWVGSRSIAQLSLVEFLLVIALGSAVGDAMFYPDVPLVHCLLVITVVVLLDKALTHIVARSSRLEDVIEGRSVEVIRDGVINCEALKAHNFGHDELFEQLRLKDIEHLGQVRGAYLETNGMISVFQATSDASIPGLEIVPPWDVTEPEKRAAGDEATSGTFACKQCGTTIDAQSGEVLPKCQNCSGKCWHRIHEASARDPGQS